MCCSCRILNLQYIFPNLRNLKPVETSVEPTAFNKPKIYHLYFGTRTSAINLGFKNTRRRRVGPVESLNTKLTIGDADKSAGQKIYLRAEIIHNHQNWKSYFGKKPATRVKFSGAQTAAANRINTWCGVAPESLNFNVNLQICGNDRLTNRLVNRRFGPLESSNTNWQICEADKSAVRWNDLRVVTFRNAKTCKPYVSRSARQISRRGDG